MACKFACSLSYSKAFNKNKVVSFRSSTGDEYRMKYKSNVCRDLLLRIEWSLAKEVLVTVKLYNKTFKRCFNSKGTVLNGNKCFMKLRGAFNICKSSDYNILCVISVFPYINFREQVRNPLLPIAPPVEKESQPVSVNNGDITSISIGILSDTTVKANEIDKQDYCREIEPIAEMQLKDFSIDRNLTSNDDLKASGMEFESFKNRETNDYLSIKDAVEFESSEQWKDTDISSCSVDETVITENHDTLLLSTVKINEQSIENEMLESFKDSTNHMQNEIDKKITPDVQNINMLPSNISVQMNPLIGFKLDEDKQILPLKDFRDANRESTVTVQEIFSNTAGSNKIIDTHLSQISAQDQENFISHSIENITMIKPMADIPDDLSLKGISTEENAAMEIEYEELSTHKPVSQSTDDIVNTGLKTADIEINTASILDENYKKNDAVKEIPSPKSSVDKYSLILDEMLMNDIQLHVELSIDPECELKNFLVEKGSKDLQMGICNTNETENERIPVHQPKLVSNDVGNVVIKKPDTEIKASSPLSETNDKSNNVSEIISPKSSTDTYSPILHEAFINDTKLKVKSSFEQKSPLKKMNFIAESGSNDLSVNIPIKSKEIQDNVISDSVTEVSESMSYLSSIKSDLVSQTLNRGISIDDSGFISSNTDETIFSSSEINVEKTASLNAVCIHSFPVMENELRGLSMDMLDLLMSGDMADGVITNGKKEIKVHRAIVSARSSVLKELFSKPIRQNMEYCATVDVPTYILEDFIVFIYVGLVRIKNLKMAKDMYRVAMKYCIKDLLHICSKYISK